MSKTPSPWHPSLWFKHAYACAALICWLSFVVAISATAAFGQDEDDEQPPGLRGRYQVNDAVVERVDADLAFQWGSSPPDSRLPAGQFTANWTGTLLLRSAETYQFHAFALGRVRLKVDGQTLLHGETKIAGWISGPATALSFGDQPFEVTYERTGDSGQLQLFWSSNDFPLEPVPYHSLFQTKPSPELSLIEQGRVQFDAYRCGNCHGSRLDPNRLQAPSLKHVGSGTSREWLIGKLMRSGAPTVVEGEKMPHFGFNRNEAESIVAALVSQAMVPEFVAAANLKQSDRAKDLQSGRTLVSSLGCLACHTWRSLGEVTPFGSAKLDAIGEKRSDEWLSTWLQSPGRLNPNHRMPVFSLTEKERSQIVLALVESSQPFDQGKSAATPPAGALIEQGQKLMAAARCAHCHDLPGAKQNVVMVAPLMKPGRDWRRSCTAPLDRAQNRPEFPSVNPVVIKAYLASWTREAAESEVAADDSQFGRRLLERKNCTNCHDRDGIRGISKHAAAIAKAEETLSGLHMTLIPPRLNAVGDRMRDAALAEAIRGEQKSPRLNWLRVRMPKFAHSEVEQAALLKNLIDHDRIPAGSPVADQAAEQIPEKPDAQQILAGRELLGGKGFSCVACHAVKEYTPKVTALGTRGSNLHLIGQRMRSEYFFRWTRAPLRVMPGVEMPNYRRPHEFILPGQLNQQLVAIWQALNDPNLTAPTNPAVVEQLLSVSRTDRPKVVRDVFTVPGSPDETVSRSYAAGLPGGHSILFDFETGSLRGWTLGDFARQRCEGKRWYWDLAGTTLAAGFEQRPDIFLVDAKTRQMLGPETGWTVAYVLNTDDREDRSVELHYDIKVSKDDTRQLLNNVVERWGATPEGWERRISVTAPAGTEVWFRNSTPKIQFDHSQINVERSPGARESQLPADAIAFWDDPESNRKVMKVSYQTSLKWELGGQTAAAAKLSPADKITSVPGFDGRRLAFPRSIMPTALAWDHRQRMMFTSLKGHLYRQESEDDQQSLTVMEGGLAAPFGLIEIPIKGADSAESQFAVVVAHKPELLKLKLDNQGQVQGRSVLASGWGVTDDYHDWTCGIVKDSVGNLFVGLGSDYTFKNRPKANSRWRGDILRIEPDGKLESIAHGLRYPTGLAIDDQDRLFCSDQQGVQNTFNELNFIQAGHRYGVPSRHEANPDAPADSPAVQIPHPWTRSVNGIVWVPKTDSKGLAPFAGQFLACEFNNHTLIRMSVQTVGDVVQGAAYAFSKPAKEGDSSNFVGPLCIGLSPVGDIYVGGLQDGGWAGGLNVGDIVKLTSSGELPNGIREIRANKSGFEIEFFHPIDPSRAAETAQFKISGYTRVWKGDYATPDSGNHACEVQSATLSADNRTVTLIVSGRKPGYVYDVSVGEIGGESQRVLWPSIGHYTLHLIPD